MNALTGAGVYVEDKLFSTLDTRTRQWHLKDWGRVLLSDTVGFIRDLPHHLIASFKATLEEARQARLLLHVVDASNPHAEEQIKAVNAVLKELGCGDKPTLLVLNKVDRVADPSFLHVLQQHHPRAVAVSAATGQGLDDLRDAVIEMLGADFADAEVETGRRQRQGAGVPGGPRGDLPAGVRRQPRDASAATCRATCCTTSRGRTCRCSFLRGTGEIARRVNRRIVDRRNSPSHVRFPRLPATGRGHLPN